MINLLTALGAPNASQAEAKGTEKPAEGETPFAGLLALLGGGKDAGTDSVEETGDGVSDLLAQAGAALADPDLSEEEIAAVLAPVIEQIGTALAADPVLLDKAKALVAKLSETLVEAGPEAEELSWRDLSKGLADLQAELSGAEEEPGDEAALAALMQLALVTAEEVAPTFVPVPSGLGQLLSLPLRDTSQVVEVAPGDQQPELPEFASDGLGRSALTEGEGAFPGTAEDEGDARAALPRAEARPVAGFALAAPPTAAHGADQLPPPGPLQVQAAPLGPVSATPLAASAMAASQLAGAAPQVAAQGQDVLGQIRASSSAEGKINVELKPEGLGKVEISLTPDEAGRMQVVVRADQAAVLSALRADRDGLMALLRDAGHAVEDGALSFADMDAQGGAQGRGQGQDGARSGGFTTYGTASAEAARAESGATTQSLALPVGSVDLRI
ncbi:flagellar hook-length control protein FliK [Salipiger mangrovisoli]|uniref:Flagellar hook-length control protein FliK n=1 Tax=Salipiger mangrovisoli TaxID=2865933 RepID=A0ABR9X0U8_9RHOB|nr:flagellar hook-length control protein FliK [Salipiger mangrovisoli]MBE9637126.1 flagellar hook-length control protein FliK [Salipiger mangrovisoli]